MDTAFPSMSWLRWYGGIESRMTSMVMPAERSVMRGFLVQLKWRDM